MKLCAEQNLETDDRTIELEGLSKNINQAKRKIDSILNEWQQGCSSLIV